MPGSSGGAAVAAAVVSRASDTAFAAGEAPFAAGCPASTCVDCCVCNACFWEGMISQDGQARSIAGGRHGKPQLAVKAAQLAVKVRLGSRRAPLDPGYHSCCSEYDISIESISSRSASRACRWHPRRHAISSRAQPPGCMTICITHTCLLLLLSCQTSLHVTVHDQQHI